MLWLLKPKCGDGSTLRHDVDARFNDAFDGHQRRGAEARLLLESRLNRAQAALQISRSDDIIKTITTDCQEDRQPTNR